MRSHLLMALAITACGSTAEQRLGYAAHARGTAPHDVLVGSWTVALDRADVAFGPAYFCASRAGAIALCELAVAEILGARRIDALDPGPQELPDVDGTTGAIGSANFDFGITYFTTQTSPTPTRATIDGASARIEGVATQGDLSLPFGASVTIAAAAQGSWAVVGMPLDEHIDADIEYELDVEFDPHAWVSAIDFDELAAAPGNRVEIDETMVSYSGLVQSMAGNAPPRFTWEELGEK